MRAVSCVYVYVCVYFYLSHLRTPPIEEAFDVRVEPVRHVLRSRV